MVYVPMPPKELRTTRQAAYVSFSSMKNRCKDKGARGKRYALRGITVCERWRSGFRFFLEDMGEPPTPFHSIDRIDVNGHYEPGNCRWVTIKEQARNRGNNVRATAFGETKLVIEWADDPRCVVCFATLRARIWYGWDHERAITTAPLTPLQSTDEARRSRWGFVRNQEQVAIS